MIFRLTFPARYPVEELCCYEIQGFKAQKLNSTRKNLSLFQLLKSKRLLNRLETFWLSVWSELNDSRRLSAIASFSHRNLFFWKRTTSHFTNRLIQILPKTCWEIVYLNGIICFYLSFQAMISRKFAKIPIMVLKMIVNKNRSGKTTFLGRVEKKLPSLLINLSDSKAQSNKI